MFTIEFSNIWDTEFRISGLSSDMFKKYLFVKDVEYIDSALNEWFKGVEIKTDVRPSAKNKGHNERGLRRLKNFLLAVCVIAGNQEIKLVRRKSEYISDHNKPLPVVLTDIIDNHNKSIS